MPLVPPTIDTIREGVSSVASAAGYRLVVLFGSVARGDAHAADIDIGVLAATPIDSLAATIRFMEALGTGAVDVVDLTRANPVLLMSVARDGVPVFDATGAEFAAFSSLAMRRYADTKKFRDAMRDDLREYAAAVRRPSP